MPAQCSGRDWETPSTPGKGSLETVGFKLTFAHFCSVTKVGRRRPSFLAGSAKTAFPPEAGRPTVGPSRLPGAVRARQPGPCLESGSLPPPQAALRRFPLGRDCQKPPRRRGAEPSADPRRAGTKKPVHPPGVPVPRCTPPRNPFSTTTGPGAQKIPAKKPPPRAAFRGARRAAGKQARDRPERGS